GFTALLTIGATIVAGLLPAWHASGGSLIATVRNEGTAFGRRLTPSRLRQILVITQVAVSLTSLSCAGLLARTLLAHRNVDVGYDAQALFGLHVIPPSTAARRASPRQVLEMVRDIPGVEAAALANPAPLLGYMRTRIRPLGASASGVEEPLLMSFVSD